MSLPYPFTFNTAHMSAYSPSVGTSPVAAYVSAPFRARLLSVTGVLGDAITTADGTVTIAVNGTTVGSFAVPQSGSGAGSMFSTVLTSPAYVNEGDVVSLTPSGASGASIPMSFGLAFRAA